MPVADPITAAFYYLISDIKNVDPSCEPSVGISIVKNEIVAPQLSKLIVDTAGGTSGGALHFQVKPIREDAFEIKEITDQSGKAYDDIKLSMNDNSTLFLYLRKVFAGYFQIKQRGSSTSPSSNQQVGSWTTVTAVDLSGKSTYYKNPVILDFDEDVQNTFDRLSLYVRETLSSNHQSKTTRTQSTHSG